MLMDKMKRLVSCLVHACQLIYVNHSYGQTLGIFPGGCLLTSLCRREGERDKVDVLFAGLLTLKKQRICEDDEYFNAQETPLGGQ